MKKVFKYPLRISDEANHVGLPSGAELLHVHEQDGRMFLWALVDPAAPLEQRVFTVHGTGHPVDNRLSFADYVGTAHCDGFVWHVFEVTRIVR